MSTLKTNNIQIGTSGTASNNFTLYQPSSPDGTIRLGIGNSGATSSDVLSLSSAGLTLTGNLTSSGTITFPAGSNTAPSITTTGDTNTGLYFPAADTAAITTGGTERMRIDSSGNVGIGAAPSTWSLGTAMQVGTANDASILGYNNSIYLTANHYFNSGWKYAATAAAARYEMNSGVHYWFSSPSGTAGTAITQTQVLQLERDKTLALQGATSKSGIGITFPADTTSTVSTDANTLDDYEEGTWTPTARGDTTAGTTTYTAQYGYYTKIGRSVTVVMRLGWSALTGTGILRIGGLPFASASNDQNYAIGAVVTNNLNWTGGTMMSAIQELNTTDMSLIYSSDDGATDRQLCVNESALVLATLTYFT